MAQKTNGVHSVLTNPTIYRIFQSIMGAHRARKMQVQELIRPFPGCTILDIGCGPADLLAYMSDVQYWGFDINESYINHAKHRFSEKGFFFCKELELSDLQQLPEFDIVLAMGLLHHLDDSVASNLFSLASRALKIGGRLLTIDPCFSKRQNPIARFLIENDRGRNVRTLDEYVALANPIFDSPRAEIRSQKWIPYTHCIMECVRH